MGYLAAYYKDLHYPVLWFLAGFLAVYALLRINPFKLIRENRRIDIRKASLDDPWVKKAVSGCAKKIVSARYASIGKPTRTKSGAYRTDYANDVSKEYQKLVRDCFSNGHLSKDFRDFLQSGYSVIRVKHFSSVVKAYVKHRQTALESSTEQFLNSLESVSPDEFFRIKNTQQGDVVGVYIIHNETKDMYYVGQAKRLFFRVNQHFTGHGNGDVYADYKYGDSFTIRIVKLSESGYSDLDMLERDLIRKYRANIRGYNKSKGNG